MILYCDAGPSRRTVKTRPNSFISCNVAGKAVHLSSRPPANGSHEQNVPLRLGEWALLGLAFIYSFSLFGASTVAGSRIAH